MNTLKSEDKNVLSPMDTNGYISLTEWISLERRSLVRNRKKGGFRWSSQCVIPFSHPHFGREDEGLHYYPHFPDSLSKRIYGKNPKVLDLKVRNLKLSKWSSGLVRSRRVLVMERMEKAG